MNITRAKYITRLKKIKSRLLTQILRNKDKKLFSLATYLIKNSVNREIKRQEKHLLKTFKRNIKTL